MTAVVPLYGGALRTQLPTTVGGRIVRFDDMSNLRQVPDHQEVYSDVDCGCAVIIELLGLEESVSSADLAAYHFSELAKANGCSRIQLTPPSTPRYWCRSPPPSSCTLTAPRPRQWPPQVPYPSLLSRPRRCSGPLLPILR